MLGGNDAEDPARALAVHEQVAAEATDAGNLVGEVGVVAAGELLARPRRGDREQQTFGVGSRQDAAPGYRRHLAVVAHRGCVAGREMQV